jgi:hypothetical protein
VLAHVKTIFSFQYSSIARASVPDNQTTLNWDRWFKQEAVLRSIDTYISDRDPWPVFSKKLPALKRMLALSEVGLFACKQELLISEIKLFSRKFNLLEGNSQLLCGKAACNFQFADLVKPSSCEVFCGFGERPSGSVKPSRYNYEPDGGSYSTESGDDGYNAYTNRPPLIRVVGLYLLSMLGGAFLGCLGALNIDGKRKRLGTALVVTGLSIATVGSVAFVIGLGLP